MFRAPRSNIEKKNFSYFFRVFSLLHFFFSLVSFPLARTHSLLRASRRFSSIIKIKNISTENLENLKSLTENSLMLDEFLCDIDIFWLLLLFVYVISELSGERSVKVRFLILMLCHREKVLLKPSTSRRKNNFYHLQKRSGEKMRENSTAQQHGTEAQEYREQGKSEHMFN